MKRLTPGSKKAAGVETVLYITASLAVHTWQHSSVLGGVISAFALLGTKPAGQAQDWLPLTARFQSVHVACNESKLSM
jgi:hypothetical protein